MENVKMSNINYYDVSFVNAEDVMLSEDKTQISIIETTSMHDYSLYNTEATKQVTPWVNGKDGHVTFSDLDPDVRYAIRVRLAKKDSKPEIIRINTLPLFDDDKKKTDS